MERLLRGYNNLTFLTKALIASRLWAISSTTSMLTGRSIDIVAAAVVVVKFESNASGELLITFLIT